MNFLILRTQKLFYIERYYIYFVIIHLQLFTVYQTLD